MIDQKVPTNTMISIYAFDNGFSSQIFEEVKKQGTLCVGNNNVIECVLLSPKKYASFMEELTNMELELLAMQRMSNSDLSNAIPAKKVYKNLGIDLNDLEGFDEIELD
ncbi:hypothetical protein [Dubosiella newyorkensis]|uniref:hypothetical protein n=1 Tax=Dubosiella newyorkensis TaxID=1862672 RepID=UPI00272C2E4F|nr:hypothetical protein [Dubosiella newyorkensis]